MRISVFRAARKFEGGVIVSNEIKGNAGFYLEGGFARIVDPIPSYALNKEEFQYLVNFADIIQTELPRKVSLYEDSLRVHFVGSFWANVLKELRLSLVAKYHNNMQRATTNSIVKGGAVLDVVYDKEVNDVLAFTLQARSVVVMQDDSGDYYYGLDAFSHLEGVAGVIRFTPFSSSSFKFGYNFRAFTDVMNKTNNVHIHSVGFSYFLKGTEGSVPFGYININYDLVKSVDALRPDDETLDIQIGFGGKY